MTDRTTPFDHARKVATETPEAGSDEWCAAVNTLRLAASLPTVGHGLTLAFWEWRESFRAMGPRNG